MFTTIKFGLGGTQFVGAETQTLDGPGREVLQEDVRAVDQAADDLAALRGLEVDGERFLAAVEPDEVRAGAVDDVVVAAREVAAVDAFHLDDAGPEVGEVAGGQRGSDGLLDRDDGDALEWKAHDALRLRLSDQSPADDQALNLTGSLVQAHQSDVAIDALDGHLTHVAGAAVDLDRQIGCLVRPFRCRTASPPTVRCVDPRR